MVDRVAGGACCCREAPGAQRAGAVRGQDLGGGLLDSLAEAGLVERRPDPADRRARRIVATVRGRALLDGLGARLRAAEDQVLAGLDDEDKKSFRSLLRRVAVHAATALDPAVPPSCTERAPGNSPGNC